MLAVVCFGLIFCVDETYSQGERKRLSKDPFMPLVRPPAPEIIIRPVYVAPTFKPEFRWPAIKIIGFVGAKAILRVEDMTGRGRAQIVPPGAELEWSGKPAGRRIVVETVVKGQSITLQATESGNTFTKTIKYIDEKKVK